MSEEIWTDIPGYEGYYQITESGLVRSIERKVNSAIQGEVIKPSVVMRVSLTKYGYLTVHLSKFGKVKGKTIHRLIAKTFIPNPNNLPCVNHKDGDKQNNSIDNLEWCTYQHNAKHAFDTGLNVMSTGQYHGSAKLTDQDVNDLKYLLDNGIIRYTEAPSLIGISRSYAYKIQHREVRNESIKREKRMISQNVSAVAKQRARDRAKAQFNGRKKSK